MSEIETPRGPGAPKGRPKPAKSGRKPGTKNKRTILGKDFVKPLLPAAKRRLRALVEGTNDDLALKAAIKILEYHYGKPTETKRIGGEPDGEPIRQELLKHSPLGADKELARRLALALDMGEQDEEPAEEFVPDGRPIGAPPRRLPEPAAAPVNGVCKPAVGAEEVLDARRGIVLRRLSDDGSPHHAGSFDICQRGKVVRHCADITAKTAAEVAKAIDQKGGFDA